MTISNGIAASGSSPRMPFPNATGLGLKIAVIDSGVNPDHPHIVAKTTCVDPVFADAVPVSNTDLLGHGTAVMAAIQEKAPGAEYFSIKLFDRSLSASSGRLLQAIQWAVNNRMDLVNLSLGTPNFDFQPAFEALVEMAADAGVILVCARFDNRKPVLPGSLPGVVSVDVDWQLTRHAFRLVQQDSASYYLASGFPRPLPGVSPARNLAGISFAVANMTGIVARASELIHSRCLPEIHLALSSQAAVVTA